MIVTVENLCTEKISKELILMLFMKYKSDRYKTPVIKIVKLPQSKISLAQESKDTLKIGPCCVKIQAIVWDCRLFLQIQQFESKSYTHFMQCTQNTAELDSEVEERKSRF